MFHLLFTTDLVNIIYRAKVEQERLKQNQRINMKRYQIITKELRPVNSGNTKVSIDTTLELSAKNSLEAIKLVLQCGVVLDDITQVTELWNTFFLSKTKIVRLWVFISLTVQHHA